MMSIHTFITSTSLHTSVKSFPSSMKFLLACFFCFSLQQQQSQKDKKEPVGTELVAMKSKSKGRDPGGDPDDDPVSNSFFKRMFKVSLAFQLVILTFVCLSCLYEPQCCDYMNNYSWSISPKLHYEGRPPI